MAWYESLSGAAEKMFGVFERLADAVNKSTLDKTEKERMLAQIEQARLTYELEAMKLRLSVPWMKWVALGSGGLLGLMIVNNYIVLPYIPSVQALEIPWYLWATFAASIGADKLADAVKPKEK